MGKARLLTLQSPRPLPASPRLSTVPRPAGSPHVVHWAPSRSPRARSSRQMRADGSVLDPQQASPARQWASRHTSQEPTQPSGSSQECLGVPDSRLLDAPFSSLPSCRQLDFPGQSRVRPGWAPSAQPGPLAALQHTTHQGSENAFPAASSASRGAGPAWNEPHVPCTHGDRETGGCGPLWSGTLGPSCPLPRKPLRRPGWAPRSLTSREAYTQHWLPRTTGRLLLPSFGGSWSTGSRTSFRLPSFPGPLLLDPGTRRPPPTQKGSVISAEQVDRPAGST